MARFRRDARVKGTHTPPLSGVVIERLSHEGRGIAHVAGKTVFVEGALPGETVSIRYTHLHGKFDEAVVTEITTPSPDRITPHCAHAERCGGCSFQHARRNSFPSDLRCGSYPGSSSRSNENGRFRKGQLSGGSADGRNGRRNCAGIRQAF